MGAGGTKPWQVLGVTAKQGRAEQTPQCADFVPAGRGQDVQSTWSRERADSLMAFEHCSPPVSGGKVQKSPVGHKRKKKKKGTFHPLRRNP